MTMKTGGKKPRENQWKKASSLKRWITLKDLKQEKEKKKDTNY